MIRSTPNSPFGLQAALAPAGTGQSANGSVAGSSDSGNGGDGSDIGGGGSGSGDGSSDEAACWGCDGTADQCVAANKCDASTNYECVPVYEEDYAICQLTDAQVRG